MKTTKPYTRNAMYQVIQAGQVSVGWDGNGNMVTKSNSYTFHYDFQNKLREATNLTGANLTMLYDPFNRRNVKKVATVAGEQDTVYLWDCDEIIEEYTKGFGNYITEGQNCDFNDTNTS